MNVKLLSQHLSWSLNEVTTTFCYFYCDILCTEFVVLILLWSAATDQIHSHTSCQTHLSKKSMTNQWCKLSWNNFVKKWLVWCHCQLRNMAFPCVRRLHSVIWHTEDYDTSIPHIKIKALHIYFSTNLLQLPWHFPGTQVHSISYGWAA